MKFTNNLTLKRAKDKALFEHKTIVLDAPILVDTYLVLRYQKDDRDCWGHYIK